MGTRTTIPKPRAVYEDPDAHLDFLTSPSDAGVEGHHFDRKEACRARPDGNVAPSELKRRDEHIAECISAFSNTNRNGGLLVSKKDRMSESRIQLILRALIPYASASSA